MARVLILGGGLIGAGWAAAFAGGGHQAIVADPDPEAGVRVAQVWQAAQPVMAALGTLRDGAEPPLHVTNAADAPTPDLVQEALPETLALKHRALAALEPLIAPDAPIASSSLAPAVAGPGPPSRPTAGTAAASPEGTAPPRTRPTSSSWM